MTLAMALSAPGDWLDTFTDAVRWWGCVAGFLGVDDFRHRYLGYRRHHRHPAIDLWLDAWAKLLVCLFLIGAGLAIPLVGRLAFFNVGMLSIVMAVMWPCVSTAGWLYVISRAANKPIMAGVATGTLACMALAAWLTAA